MSLQKNNLNDQGAFLPSKITFYRTSFDYIKNNDHVLNIGCGGLFFFEKALFLLKHAHITCIDILTNLNKPSYVEKLIIQNIEKEFNLNKKFDVITCYEIIEHIDKTDVLLKNCYRHLKTDGYLIITIPNLSSIFSRIEILLGLQPHILEISNEASFGGGLFSKLNNKHRRTIHHIRGITRKAMIEFLNYHKFEIIKEFGYFHKLGLTFQIFLGFAPVNIFICRKI